MLPPELVSALTSRLAKERCKRILDQLGETTIPKDRISALALFHLGLSALASYGMPRDEVHRVVDEIYDRMVAEIKAHRAKR